jgi:hypothetical protein
MATKYLRQFPGKRVFERVSKSDFNAPMPYKDIAGFGHILRLEGEVRVFSPDGELEIARKWPSRSYIRNFARILRNIFGQNVQLVAQDGTLWTVGLDNANFSTSGGGLIAEIISALNPAVIGQAANPELSGAAFAVGDGVAAEVHTRNDLVNRVGGIYSARQNLVTTVLNTLTTTLQITSGITNAQAAAISVTEIGMFLYAMTIAQRFSVPFATLMAYDSIPATPVASGGVIAPRYTMDFPV